MRATRFCVVFFALFCASVKASDHASAEKGHEARFATVESAGATNGEFGNIFMTLPVYKGVMAEYFRYYSMNRSFQGFGAGYAFELRHDLVIMPSLYRTSGVNEHDRIAGGVRMAYEGKLFVSEFGLIQTFGGPETEDHDTFLDPSHISVRLPGYLLPKALEDKVTTGFAFELFRHKGGTDKTAGPEDDHLAETHADAHAHPTRETLRGIRVGVEVSHNAHFAFYVLKNGHGWEYKGGTNIYLDKMLGRLFRQH